MSRDKRHQSVGVKLGALFGFLVAVTAGIAVFVTRSMARDARRREQSEAALRAHQKGLEPVFHAAADVPDRLVGNAGRLRQVVVNLIGSAIKFTSAGEVVERVSLESLTGGTALLRFSVSDTGVGIPSEKQAVIFDAFSQADGTTTRR